VTQLGLLLAAQPKLAQAVVAGTPMNERVSKFGG
jgi:hypothetical protein